MIGGPTRTMDGNGLVEKFWKKEKFNKALTHRLANLFLRIDNHTFQMKCHLVMVDLSWLVISIYYFDQMITKLSPQFGTSPLLDENHPKSSKPRGRMLKKPEKSATAVLMVAQTA